MNELKKIRTRKGLLQKEIAQKLQINERTYSGYETGSRKIPLETALKLSKILNRTVEEIFEDVKS